jgi:hypothetical protein
VALFAALSLSLTTTAGADSGYPGTTTVTTVPGGSTSPSGGTNPGGSTSPSGGINPATGTGPSGGINPATGTGPSDPCATPGACSSGATAGTLAFTGADLLALIVGALFLLAMGTLLVVFTRRRAMHQRI